MTNKAKSALVAAFVLVSASAALAQSGEEIQNSQYQLNPNAAVPIYSQAAPQQPALIEGRNVSVGRQAAPAQHNNSVDRLRSYGGY
jgi:hypothetical protein